MKTMVSSPIKLKTDLAKEVIRGNHEMVEEISTESKPGKHIFGCFTKLILHLSKSLLATQWLSRALECQQVDQQIFSKYSENELLQLLTSNFFSILYYKSEVWHLSSLSYMNNKQFLSASAEALRVALHYPGMSISYYNLHKTVKRATPSSFATTSEHCCYTEHSINRYLKLTGCL
jgi:hypothetical protein